jgi:hypothetical protein
MAEILGLTVADFPYLRMKPQYLPSVIMGNMARGWLDKPHLKDPKNWPQAMQDDWAMDQGLAVAQAVQARQIEQFRKLRQAIDELRPDLMVFLYRDLGETFRTHASPRYWIHAHEHVDTKLFQIHGIRENYFEEDPERVDTLQGHREAALHLARRLQDRGFDPLYARESMHPNGLGHNALATAVHLDWDRRRFDTPIVPVAVDPFGFLRTRNAEGLSPWNRDAPGPLTPREAFTLGQAIAGIYRESAWRVAIVAGVDWSHANDTAVDRERIHPDSEADRVRYDQWRNNEFDRWGDTWTFEEMEEHAQWELLVTIILAGAMTAIGAKVRYSHFEPTWLFNDDYVTTIFEVR